MTKQIIIALSATSFFAGVFTCLLASSAHGTTEDYLECVAWVRSEFSHRSIDEQDTLIIIHCDPYLNQ